jgi:hypothetical protein
MNPSGLQGQWREALVPGLREGEDYVKISAAEWESLLAAFGGGPTLLREVVELCDGRLVVNVYPKRATVSSGIQQATVEFHDQVQK